MKGNENGKSYFCQTSGTLLYVLDGTGELNARRDLVHEWFEMVEAPIKRLYTFEESGHAPAFEQFEDFGQIMRENILSETYSN